MSHGLLWRLMLIPRRPAPVTTDRVMLLATAGWLTVAVAATIFVIFFAPAGLWWLPLLGLGPAPLYYAVSRHWRDVTTAVTVVDGRATVRGRRYYPAGLLTSFVMMLLVALSWVTTPGGSAAGRAVTILFATAFFLPVPDLIRTTVIRTGVTFDADSIHLRTFGHDVRISWSDVFSVVMSAPGGLASVITIVLRRPADERAVRRRRFLFSFQARPRKGDGFTINPFTLDEPWLLYAQLAILLQLDRHGRDRYLRSVGADLLTGRLPVPQEVRTMAFGPFPTMPRPPFES